MAFSALIRTLERSQLAAELLSKLQQHQILKIDRLAPYTISQSLDLLNNAILADDLY